MDGSWLRPQMGTTTGAARPPQAFMVALRHVALALDADPDWRRWWHASGLAACELGIVTESALDHLRPSADIRRLDDHLKANFTCTPPATGDDPAGLAMAEVRAMFEVIRQALGLPPLPATPPLPTLPADAADVPVTTRPLPAAHEPDQQGYLTLTQIQEFFG